jgi:hydroxymethylglutaryl-CoA reductase
MTTGVPWCPNPFPVPKPTTTLTKWPQRECLELLGCYGAGKVSKFAEIVAATVLCGEMSLAGAIASEEWVEAHDRFGRNRP